MTGVGFMKKMLILFLAAILLTTFTGCTKEEIKELIRVANSTNDFKEISNKKDISNIKDIMTRVEWKESLKRPSDKESYSFWLEKEGNKERLTNYEVWFEDNQTIVFDKLNGKYGLVDNSDAPNLEQHLK
jgi:hypothetical protein